MMTPIFRLASLPRELSALRRHRVWGWIQVAGRANPSTHGRIWAELPRQDPLGIGRYIRQVSRHSLDARPTHCVTDEDVGDGETVLDQPRFALQSAVEDGQATLCLPGVLFVDR